MDKTAVPIPMTFSILGNFLSDFLQALPHPAHVKDAKTGKYILTNEKNIKIYGLETIEELIGTTVDDLNVFMSSCWDKGYASTVDALDRKAIQSRSVVIDDNRIMLVHDGFVRVQNMVKIPVLGINNDVKAIATFSYPRIKEVELNELFNIYKKFYPQRQQAIFFFLKYLKIDVYFNELLTEAELKLLLVMKRDNTNKTSANELGITVKTIEAHRSKIRNKLKKPNLSELLAVIRNESYYDIT